MGVKILILVVIAIVSFCLWMYSDCKEECQRYNDLMNGVRYLYFKEK